VLAWLGWLKFDNLQLAYDLGHLGTMLEPLHRSLAFRTGRVRPENELGKQVVCNKTAANREMMILLNGWKPMPGRRRLLATP
jgi:hypothetical protein